MTKGAGRHTNPVEVDRTVSVVITCYSHGRFLREAIESVLAQSYRNFEIIIVDDGSTDDTSQIAATYPSVQYIYQANSGPAAARNTGLRHTKGKFVVFLDADDRLLSTGLEAGIYHLNAHPECGFVSGRYAVIRSNGQIKPPAGHMMVQKDHYTELLRGNYIGMHGTVMYRRAVLESVDGFDSSLAACEDYDIYLRIARTCPVFCHDSVVAEYRHHSDNMIANRALMLKSSQKVLRAHRKCLRDAKEMVAFAHGIRFWQRFYGDRLLGELRGSTRQSIRNIPLFVRYYPRGFARLTVGLIIDLLRVFSRTLRRVPTRTVEMVTQMYFSWWRGFQKGQPPVGGVRLGDLRRCTPISRHFGFDRGLPIDRYYIERFLSINKDNIRGRVLEIGDDTYTRRFGNGRVVKADVFDVSANNAKATFVGDLSCATHIPSEAFDSVIFTQTLQLIYDPKSALRTVYRILKPGGVLLATFPGISQIIRDSWRQYWCWNFTEVSAQRLFTEIFPQANVSIDVAGNVLAATAFLYGLAAVELRRSELDYRDPEYELLIAVKAIKPFQDNAARR
jgi:glycosyltransferase involved in cell wall biosynthesis